MQRKFRITYGEEGRKKITETAILPQELGRFPSLEPARELLTGPGLEELQMTVNDFVFRLTLDMSCDGSSANVKPYQLQRTAETAVIKTTGDHQFLRVQSEADGGWIGRCLKCGLYARIRGTEVLELWR